MNLEVLICKITYICDLDKKEKINPKKEMI